MYSAMPTIIRMEKYASLSFYGGSAGKPRGILDERTGVKLNMESKIRLLLKRITKCFKMQVYEVLLKRKETELCFLTWDGLMKESWVAFIFVLLCLFLFLVSSDFSKNMLISVDTLSRCNYQQGTWNSLSNWNILKIKTVFSANLNLQSSL